MLSSGTIAVAIVAALGLCPPIASALISNDSHFYGESPPVYPSPIGTGTGDWAAAYAQAAAFVAQLTIQEKVNLTVGTTTTTGCSGQIYPISRLNFPGLCLQDAGNGVRATDFVTGFASGLSVGASWNKELAYERGLAMGGEFYKKGVNIALGPVVGPLGRIAEGGRNWEGFANDPYLSGALAAESIRGVQERGVMTSVKHFIGNEQETNRNPSTNANGTTIEAVSSNIDDKTIHELYLWPFADAIRAGSANVMCSYNRLNNSYACANSKTLNGLLKTELGFQGFVVSDWGAQHAGVATALSGLDMAMASGGKFWGANTITAVQNGSIPESRLDDMATRIIAAWYKLGQNSASQPAPGIGLPKSLTKPHPIVDARDPAAKPTIFAGAVEGHVLVKNTGGVLPLKAPKVLSIYGYDARIQTSYTPGSTAWTLGTGGTNTTLILAGFSGVTVSPSELSQIAINGTLFTGGGSGANTPTYISGPFDAISQRAVKDDTALFWDFESTNPTISGTPGPCLVFINAFATEGEDRPGVADEYSDTLVNNVADKCNNTIVIIHNAGVRLVDGFVDHPNVTAIIYAHLPGQDSGTAITSLLYGDSYFSGKLPYSVPKNESAYGSLLAPSLPQGEDIFFPQSDFTEGVYIDYRAFDRSNITTPRYAFGHGLSYTTFTYTTLTIASVSNITTTYKPYPTGPIIPGGHADLWDQLYTVSATIQNTGSRVGAEVAQLYIGIPGGPVRQLRGFKKVEIGIGEHVVVEFPVLRRDLSVWDVVAQAWELQRGQYGVFVGGSSRDLPLGGVLVV